MRLGILKGERMGFRRVVVRSIVLIMAVGVVGPVPSGAEEAESFREQMVKNLLIRQVMGREVYSQVALEDEDLRRYYQENPEEFTVAPRRQLREVVVLESETPEEERLQDDGLDRSGLDRPRRPGAAARGGPDRSCSW